MDNLLSIALEAHHDQQNRHRRYEIIVGRDLFGDWTVTVRYGRAGSPLRSICFADPDERVMRRVVHERLRRRVSARRRIGCAYRPRDISAGAGIEMAEWVPPTLFARLWVEGAPQTDVEAR